MIDELLQLSRDMTESEGFAPRAVHWVIDLDDQGRFLGLSPTIHASQRNGKQLEPVLGKRFQVPVYYFASVNAKREVIATAGGGKAVAELGVGNVAEIFGVKIQSKRGESVRIEKLPAKDVQELPTLILANRSLGNATAEHGRTICGYGAVVRLLANWTRLGVRNALPTS